MDVWVMKVDEDVQISQLAENETMALDDACLTWKEAEKAVLRFSAH